MLVYIVVPPLRVTVCNRDSPNLITLPHVRFSSRVDGKSSSNHEDIGKVTGTTTHNHASRLHLQLEETRVEIVYSSSSR